MEIVDPRLVMRAARSLPAAVFLMSLLALGPLPDARAQGVGPSGAVRCGCGRTLPCSVHQAPQRNPNPGPRNPVTYTPQYLDIKGLDHLGGGRYRPADGWDWVSDDPKDFRVRRKVRPGTAHPNHSNVIMGNKDGWIAAKGYQWVDPYDAKDFRVELFPDGTPHGRFPNVVWTGEGKLRAADGYFWSSVEGDPYGVVPVPGVEQRWFEIEQSLAIEEARIEKAEHFQREGERLLLVSDLEGARLAYEKARSVAPRFSWDGNDANRALRMIERRIQKRSRTTKAKTTRKIIASDSLVRIEVPSPVALGQRYVETSPDRGDWSTTDVEPVVAVGRKGLDAVAKKVKKKGKGKANAWAKKKVPGYRIYKSTKDKLDEINKMIRNRRLRMSNFVLLSLGRAVEELANPYSDGTFEEEYAAEMGARFDEEESFYNRLIGGKIKGWLKGGR